MLIYKKPTQVLIGEQGYQFKYKINFKLNQNNTMQMQNSVTQIGNFSYYPSQSVGKGATGLVYKGFRNQDRLPVAVKVIRLQEINTSVKKHLLDMEVAALQTVKNRYVCQAYDVMKDNQFYYVPLEFCPNGTLRQYIKNKGKLNQGQALSLFSKIVQGYCAIRQAGFIHRDLKSQNILLRGNMDPAIIDFGYCQKIQTQGRRLPYNVGSPAYMSPQAYNQSMYSQKSDIWALGIVFHQMLTGTIPVMRTSDVDQYFKYLAKMQTAQIVRGSQSQNSNRILLSALTVDVQSRPNGQQLKSMLASSTNISSPIKSKANSQQFSPLIQNSVGINRLNSNLQTRQNITPALNQNKLNFSQRLYIVPNRQIDIGKPNIGHTYSNQSNSSGSYYDKLGGSPLLSPNQKPHQLQNNPNFGDLRKRIVTNGPSFNINLTPIRPSNPYNQNQNFSRFHTDKRQPRTPMLAYKVQNEPIQQFGPKLRKSQSFSNFNLSNNNAANFNNNQRVVQYY